MLTGAQISDFCSPSTHEPLQLTAHGWSSSNDKFPLIDGIPWLLPMPSLKLAYMQNAIDAMEKGLEIDIAQLKIERDDNTNLRTTSDRLERLRKLHIHRKEFLHSLLSSIRAIAPLPRELLEAGGFKIQGQTSQLLSYSRNILRDWAFNTGENEAVFEVLKDLVKEISQKTAVLGMGAGRLTYDYHQAGLSEKTIGLDLNPVMLLTAKSLFEGNGLHVADISYAPKDKKNVGEILPCRIPTPLLPGLSLAFADAYDLPFPTESIDTVITPWLIDILPQPLEVLTREIHRVLKLGGRWINIGFLNFMLPDRRKNYVCEEVEELLSVEGFAQIQMLQRKTPYLISPMSAQERTELLTAYRAVKTGPARANQQSAEDWRQNTSLPVPILDSMKAYAGTANMQLKIFSYIDGATSVDNVADHLQQKFNINREQARALVLQFLSHFR